MTGGKAREELKCNFKKRKKVVEDDYFSSTADISVIQEKQQQQQQQQQQQHKPPKSSSSALYRTNGGGCKTKSFHLALCLFIQLIFNALIPDWPPAILKCNASTLTDFDGATFYKAPVGSRVRIACNGTHWTDESVSLVLWFKGTIERHSVPIYTVDARQRALNSGARHFVSDAYKGRAKFVTKATPPYLDLSPLEEEDQSEYRCRIDYRSKPRENFLIILFVLVPPKSVHIMDSNGRSLEQIYGPLSEASNLTLLCISKGGRPAPSLTWRRRTKVIDDSYLTLNDFLALKQSGQLLSSSAFHNSRASSSVSSQFELTSQASGLFSMLNFSRQQEGGKDKSDNNQQQTRRLNSINTASGQAQAYNQLESLWLEWKSWPEFDFFSQQIMTTTTTTSEQQHNSLNANHADEFKSSKVIMPVSNYSKEEEQQESLYLELEEQQQQQQQQRKHQVGGSEWSAGTDQLGRQQLLKMSVHESITTAANVLKLNNLLHQLQAPLPQADSSSFRLPSSSAKLTSEHYTSPSSKVQRTTSEQFKLAQIECQASNLHYDLRTLIKLFAPPSLNALGLKAGQQAVAGVASAELPSFAKQSEQQQQQQQQQSHPWRQPQMNSEWATRQLVYAINGALETSLKTSQLQAVSNSTSARQTAPEAPGATFESTSTSARQAPQGVRLTETANSSSVQAELLVASSQQQQPASADNDGTNILSGVAGASLLYQQLWRPHQLSSASAADLITQPEQQQHQQLVRTKLIALDIYLRPLEVKILVPQRPLSAGQLAEFSCTSSGSQPAAKLSWYKNHHLLESKLSRQLNEPNGNSSFSKLTIQLEQQDHGAQLVCRAENEHLTRLEYSTTTPSSTTTTTTTNSSEQASEKPISIIEDSVTLTVYYPPKVRLELGNKMLSTEIREGSDIFFVCSIDSNPPVKEITWLHNERQVNESSTKSLSDREQVFLSQQKEQTFQPNAARNIPTIISDSSAGLIISNNSLVLQRVKVEQRGQYACMASNSEGLSESNRIELRVLHAPICAPPIKPIGQQQQQQQQQQSGLLLVTSKRMQLKSRTRFLCRMEADPPDLEVSWYLNNTFNERRLLFSSSLNQSASQNTNNKNSNPNNNNNNNNNNKQQDQLDEPDQRVQLRSSGAAGNKQRTTTTTGSQIQPAASTSQLSYQLDTNLDYGRLYCVARNSIGEQKRACVYEIQQPDTANEASAAHMLSCLAVNITSGSAWIGCDVGGASLSVIQNSDEQNQYKFSIEVFQLNNDESLSSSSREEQAASYVNNNEPELEEQAQLEANLTSAYLREPLFSLNNLKPHSRYRLLVRLVDSFANRHLEPAAEIELETKSTSPEFTSDQVMRHEATPIGGEQQLSVSPVSAQLAMGQLSALISTRSTNGHQSAVAGSNLRSPTTDQSADRFRLAQQQTNWWNKIVGQSNSALDTVTKMFQTLINSNNSTTLDHNNQPQQTFSNRSFATKMNNLKRIGQQQQQNLLREDSSVFIIGAVSLILVGSVLIVIFLHHYSWSFCVSNNRQRSHTIRGVGNLEKNKKVKKKKQKKKQAPKGRQPSDDWPPPTPPRANHQGGDGDSFALKKGPIDPEDRSVGTEDAGQALAMDNYAGSGTGEDSNSTSSRPTIAHKHATLTLDSRARHSNLRVRPAGTTNPNYTPLSDTTNAGLSTTYSSLYGSSLRPQRGQQHFQMSSIAATGDNCSTVSLSRVSKSRSSNCLESALKPGASLYVNNNNNINNTTDHESARLIHYTRSTNNNHAAAALIGDANFSNTHKSSSNSNYVWPTAQQQQSKCWPQYQLHQVSPADDEQQQQHQTELLHHLLFQANDDPNGESFDQTNSNNNPHGLYELTHLADVSNHFVESNHLENSLLPQTGSVSVCGSDGETNNCLAGTNADQNSLMGQVSSRDHLNVSPAHNSQSGHQSNGGVNIHLDQAHHLLTTTTNRLAQQTNQQQQQQVLGFVLLPNSNTKQDHFVSNGIPHNRIKPTFRRTNFGSHSTGHQSCSLISDESSDSTAQCTLSHQHANNNNTAIPLNDLSSEQMFGDYERRFIELLPSVGAATTEFDACLRGGADVELMNRMMMSPSCLGGGANDNLNNLYVGEKIQNCMLIASPSVGSSSIGNDQEATHSPASLTNTTISNLTNTESLVNNEQNRQQEPNLKRKQTSVAKLTSILKNSSSTISSLQGINVKQQQECECNGRKDSVNFKLDEL